MRFRFEMSFRFMASLLLVLSVGAGGLTACSTNPVTGKREILLMSPEQEKALGAQAAEQVKAEIGLVDDAQLTAYVRAIGDRLAAVSPRQDVDYQFFVANMEEPNAFALPGGYIYVSRGLMALANSEAELANVIGHEIGHVAAKHSAQRQTRATGVGILTAIGTVIAGAKGGAQAAQTASQLGQVAGAGLIASYSRDQERQSDEIGQKMAAETGWDPAGMRDFMASLGRYAEHQSGQKRQATWFDSHPTTTERVQTSDARAKDLNVVPRAPIANGTLGFYNKLDGLLIGADPASGVFRDSLFLHPGLEFTVQFPAGWETQNQPAVVLAAPESRAAMLQLEGQGAGGDPRSAANTYAQENKLQLVRGSAIEVHGYQAYHALAQADTQQGKLGLHLTWIAHPKMMVRVTGMAAADQFNTFATNFDNTAKSFRGLSSAERNSITEQRLDVVTVNRGESLSSLSQRAGNKWSVEETKVMNALTSDVLRIGQPLKIGIEVPYRRQ